MSAYLDNSATTKPCEECVSAVVNMLTDNFGNASSLHDLGIKAMKEIILARGAVADSLGVDKDESYSLPVQRRLTIWFCLVQPVQKGGLAKDCYNRY